MFDPLCPFVWNNPVKTSPFFLNWLRVSSKWENAKVNRKNASFYYSCWLFLNINFHITRVHICDGGVQTPASDLSIPLNRVSGGEMDAPWYLVNECRRVAHHSLWQVARGFQATWNRHAAFRRSPEVFALRLGIVEHAFIYMVRFSAVIMRWSWRFGLLYPRK